MEEIKFIKNEDLRIGNYVSKDGKTFKITKGFEIDNSECEVFPFTPIKISEEILLKCGIAKWINTTFEIRKNIDPTFSIYSWREGKSIFICHIEYLHQFQNIYPFLMREELEIKF